MWYAELKNLSKKYSKYSILLNNGLISTYEDIVLLLFYQNFKNF